MSLVQCMERVASVKRPHLPKGRYDAWSRSASDHLRKEVARTILTEVGREDLVRSCSSASPFEFFKSLPDVGWGEEPDHLCLGLTLVRALYSKDRDMRSGVDRTKVAFDTFRASEVACGTVNRRFLRESDLFGHLSGDVGAVVHAAQRKISQILGEAPMVDDLKPSFGPGAAATCRKYTTARHKLSTPPSISSSAIPIALKLVGGMAAWYDLHRKVEVVPGCLEFVPKNYATDRTIVIEPSLTGCYQRAVGALIKRRLKRAGVDLYDQSINRERARVGSITGSDNCTIDLKSASDSIAYGLVMELLPLPWFELLDALRSERVTCPDGKTLVLQKFSSMGNGYTFELESLLFYSLAYGLSTRFNVPFDLTVYGDDLICNESLARLIHAWFPFFGFTVNQQKSYLNGHFRESCGGDYWRGVDVRPYYIRDRLRFHDVVCWYNHLCRKPHQDASGKIRNLLLSYLPTEYKIFGPDGYGDGHLVAVDEPIKGLKPFGRKRGWEGYIFETYVEVPTRHIEPVKGDVILPAYLASVMPYGYGQFEPADRLAFDVHVPKGLRSYFLKSLLRELTTDLCEPSDHYVVRKPSRGRVKGRRVRVYVLGPHF